MPQPEPRFRFPRLKLTVSIGTRPHIHAPSWGTYHRKPNRHSSGGTGISLPFIHISILWGMT